MTTIGIGSSQDPNPTLAFKEAAIMAKHQINLPESDLVLIFSTDEYPLDQNAFNTIQKILQPKRSIYALTTGLIIPQGTAPRGVGILAISSKDIRFGISTRNNLNQTLLHEAGLRLGREAVTSLGTPKRQGFISFVSGPQKNQLLLRGLQESLGHTLPIIGAISSGQIAKESSLIALDGTTQESAAIGLLIGGTEPVIVATRHGWQPLGRPRIITDAEGGIIRKIDGQPAIDLYSNYFPEDLITMTPYKFRNLGLLYPLGISTDTPRTYYIRHITDILSDGSLSCQGDVAKGRTIYLMISDKDACRQAAHDAAMEVREKLNGHTPKMLLIFESMARQRLLGRGASHEISLIKEIFGFATPVFGMYTYGELAPAKGSQKHTQDTQLQSASIVIAAIG
ncbi:MAG: FIST C-terminal domain-containing protein [Candidatus Omnitrophica bacterium]|nr:FIST C-terminal domain-containing protein [Candidatus Omnitrophota bacterium]